MGKKDRLPIINFYPDEDKLPNCYSSVRHSTRKGDNVINQPPGGSVFLLSVEQN